MSDHLCAMCGQPMHRYGFPSDGQGHEPSEVGCVNTLRGVIERLTAENTATPVTSPLREIARDALIDLIDAHNQWCGRCAPGEPRECGDRSEAEARLIEVGRL